MPRHAAAGLDDASPARETMPPQSYCGIVTLARPTQADVALGMLEIRHGDGDRRQMPKMSVIERHDCVQIYELLVLLLFGLRVSVGKDRAGWRQKGRLVERAERANSPSGMTSVSPPHFVHAGAAYTTGARRSSRRV
jgi:hypothetical protein